MQTGINLEFAIFALIVLGVVGAIAAVALQHRHGGQPALYLAAFFFLGALSMLLVLWFFG